MPGFSNYFQVAATNHIAHVAAYSFPGTLYLALLGPGNIEVTGGGYARQSINFLAAAEDGSSDVFCAQDGDITFGPRAIGGPAWGLITIARVYDAPTGGNFLYEWNNLVTVLGSEGDGKIVVYPSGGLKCTTDFLNQSSGAQLGNLMSTRSFLKQVMNMMLRGTVYQPDLFLALLSAWDTGAESFTDLVEPGYARVAANGIWQADIWFGTPPVRPAASNKVDVFFGPATGTWSRFTWYVALMDAASGGNFLTMIDPMGTGGAPTAGDRVKHPASTAGLANFSSGLYLKVLN